MFRPWSLGVLAVSLAIGWAGNVRAADEAAVGTKNGSAQDAEFFETQIRPVLAEQCLKCHGPEKQKSGLRLDSRAALLQGGDSGPAIVPGDVEKSLLIAAIRQTGDVSMPPKTRLTDAQIGLFSQWVQHGAVWPDSPAAPTLAGKPASNGSAGPEWTDAQKHWWAFQPLHPISPPAVADGSAVRNPIDRFLQHEFEARGLKPLAPADKRTLLRRATFDLTGLPPTPEEIDAFLADRSPEAFDRVIDRLLASPHYGERWGRHWLDVVRYTDYLGGNNPGPQEYAEAYRYRDWVVKSFNRDLPYDRFIEKQIAGDLLPGRQLAPTGLLAIGVYDNADSDKNKIVSDIVADQIDVVSKAFLGLTVACARCHDHKFDPISQRDYYSLAGFFYSSRVLSSVGKPGLASDFLRPTLEGNDYTKRYEDIDGKIKGLVAQLKKVDESMALAANKNTVPVAGAPAANPPNSAAAPDAAASDATPKGGDLAQKRQRLVSERDGLQNQLAALKPPTYFVAIEDGGVPEGLFPGIQDVPIHLRGSYAHLGAVVPRGFPRILAGDKPLTIAHGSGRLELAQWLASAGNPLTARVMANRIWQGHFGEGLVRTTNNFGRQGDPPANAALLDWLASEFIQSGWSVKTMHRLVMRSAAYQRAALHEDDSHALLDTDPENRLLARFPTQRLQAEEIRDAMLVAGGTFDPALGGPATPDVQSPRRSLYIATTRKNRTNFSTLFDAADPENCVERRDVSTVAPQALFFLNNPFVYAEARALAARLIGESGDPSTRIDRAYVRLYGRLPDAGEKQIGLDFLARHAGTDESRRWMDYAHLLLCANEFLTLD